MSKYKKVLAGTLAATMVLGSSFAALAADATGGSTGAGSVDVPEASNIFQVKLPVQPEEDQPSQFDYILDPTGAIEATDAAKYNGATFADDATVYFQNKADSTTASGAASGAASGGANAGVSYSDTTDAQKVINKSTMAVNVTVRAEVAESEKISMSENKTFAANDKSASLYLALKDASGETAITTTAAASKGGTINPTDDAYEVKYESGKYVKKLKADLEDDDFQAYSFYLTGACNPNGEWDGLAGTENAPEVTVTWSVTDPTAAPTGPQVSITPGGVVTISGLSAETDPTDMNLIDVGTGTPYNLTTQPTTWTYTGSAADGTIIVRLGEEWYGLANMPVRIEITLPGNSVISGTTTLGTGPSAD